MFENYCMHADSILIRVSTIFHQRYGGVTVSLSTTSTWYCSYDVPVAGLLYLLRVLFSREVGRVHRTSNTLAGHDLDARQLRALVMNSYHL